MALDKNVPLGRAIERSGSIVVIPVLGGLHHQYGRDKRIKSRPLCKAAYANIRIKLSTYVRNALLRIRLDGGRWLRRQLKHRRFLTRHEFC